MFSDQRNTFYNNGYQLSSLLSTNSLQTNTPLQPLPVIDFEAAKRVGVLGLKLDISRLQLEDGVCLSVEKKGKGKVKDDDTAAIHFNLAALQIGNWKKDIEEDKELMAKIYFKKKIIACETFNRIQDCRLKVRIMFNMSDIAFMKPFPSAKNPEYLEIQLNKSPQFFHEDTPKPRSHTKWLQTHDFTTDNAASSLCVHRLTFKTRSKHNDFAQIMRAHPDRKMLSDDQNNLLFAEQLNFEDKNPSSNISSYTYLSCERGNLPVFNQPPKYGELGQIFNQVEHPMLNCDQPHFINNQLSYDSLTIAGVHQVPSGSQPESPSYAIEHRQINGYEGAAQNHQTMDNFQMCQQQINGYEGIIKPHQSIDVYCSQQQSSNGYTGAVQYHQLIDNSQIEQSIHVYGSTVQHKQLKDFFHYQQQINSNRGSIQSYQPPGNCQMFQQNINVYEGVIQQHMNGYTSTVQYHPPTNSRQLCQQHINSYGNVVQHHQSTDICHCHHSNGYMGNVQYRQPTDNYQLYRQQSDSYESSFQHHQSTDNSPLSSSTNGYGTTYDVAEHKDL